MPREGKEKEQQQNQRTFDSWEEASRRRRSLKTDDVWSLRGFSLSSREPDSDVEEPRLTFCEAHPNDEDRNEGDGG